MATAAQIRANRANARRSTGPRTADGKARSSMNGLKHGLRSHLPVPETPEFKGLRAAFQMEWRPSTPEAHFLVETLAIEAWRTRYIDRLMELAFRHPDPKVVVAKVFTLVRHLSASANAFFRTVHRLEALPTGTDRRVDSFHVRTQSLPKFLATNELRPKCRAHLSPRWLTALPNASNPRFRPLQSLPKNPPQGPKPHFRAHPCRAGPPSHPYTRSKISTTRLRTVDVSLDNVHLNDPEKWT